MMEVEQHFLEPCEVIWAACILYYIGPSVRDYSKCWCHFSSLDAFKWDVADWKHLIEKEGEIMQVQALHMYQFAIKDFGRLCS